MDLTRLDHPEKRVLRALYELARCDHPARPDVLARALDMDPLTVTQALASLAAHGLVDSVRVRLTLPGLAVAVRVPKLPAEVLATIGLHAESVGAGAERRGPTWLRSQGAR